MLACGAATPESATPTRDITSAPQPSPTPLPTATPRPTEVPRPRVLRVNGGALPDVLEPQKATRVSEWAHLQLLFEGLTRLDEHLQPIPAAAEKWEYNASATELTLALRKGLKYSDGSLLNAARFAYALKRNLNPRTTGEYGALLDDIKGALEWRTARADAKPDDLKKLESAVDASIQALDTSGKPCKIGKDAFTQDDCLTLKLVFARPAPYFHVILATALGYPIKEENLDAAKDRWNTLRALVGNGAFVVTSIEPGVRVRFEPNPHYRGEPARTLIEFLYQTDSAAAVQAYKKNALDVVVVSPDDVAKIQADAEIAAQLVLTPGACTFGVMFALDKEPFSDPRVRQAFALAIDRDAFVKEVLRGAAKPALTWIPPGFPAYPADEKRWAFDAAAAKKALSESRYGSTGKFPTVTLTFINDARTRPRYEWLQKQWKQVLGVEVKLNAVDATTYASLTRDPKTSPQMSLHGWCALYPDPHYWLSLYWKTGTVADRFKYSNKTLDQLLTEADATVDTQRRLELYGKAHSTLMGDVPAVFLWHSVNAYLLKPWVKEYKPTPFDRWFPGDTSPARIDIDLALLPK